MLLRSLECFLVDARCEDLRERQRKRGKEALDAKRGKDIALHKMWAHLPGGLVLLLELLQRIVQLVQHLVLLQHPAEPSNT